MSWNPVLNFIIKIKNEYKMRFPQDKNCVYSYSNSNFNNAVSYWIDKLNNNEYAAIIEPLLINQYKNFILVKYNSLDIDWDIYNKFYRECRSIVIDIENNCIVLCPFRKFFNLNENAENQYNIVKKEIEKAKTIEISEKLDGSMVSAAWYNNKLIVSGSQALDTENSYRLRNYYNWFNDNPRAIKMLQENVGYTFIFEGIFPDDPHVVLYSENDYGLHLVGIRCNFNGDDYSYKDIQEIAKFYKVSYTPTFNKTFDEVVQETKDNSVRSDEAEGYVINIDGHRIKLKYVDYVMMHKALSKIISPNFILDSVRQGNIDDLLSKIPEAYKHQADEVVNNIYSYIKDIDYWTKFWIKELKNSYQEQSRKEQMIWVTNNVPEYYQAYVRNYILGRKNDYLKKKYKDILKYLSK